MFGFLIRLFFLGMATVVSAIILELVGGLILESAIPNESMLNVNMTKPRRYSLMKRRG